MVVDYWAWAHLENPQLRHEMKSDNFDDDLADMEREAAALEAKHALIAAEAGEEWDVVVGDS